ncbi:hypothetical protein HN789_01020 [archaeon]|jgi:anthranilate phosphoribosyltransferase|nr:hypothetical protein [archaeon]MBT4272723.1 hypothetical protein [archaeon]MBT4461522.1 hypothetical protein [archaeon]MBT4857709.1 hypothetical protein [archaeon]MBT5423898.1 hypothetical protein [archaeon]
MTHDINPAKELLYQINAGVDEIDFDLVKSGFKHALETECDQRDTSLGSILTGLMAKGPKRHEVIALVEAALSLDGFSPYDEDKPRVELPEGEMLVGALGSGKKGIKTMNISTPAGLVAAAAGLYFAKPGSSSTSSVTGSADFMDRVGANIDIHLEEMIKVIQETRYGFFRIEGLIPNFDEIYGGKFDIPHALSLVFPALLSPVALDHLFYGVAHKELELSAQLLEYFRETNFIVSSSTPDGVHYLDELGVYGTNRIIGKREDQGRLGKVLCIQPTNEFGLPEYDAEDISPGVTPEENVQYVINVLAGKGEEARKDIVAINAGLLLYVGKKADSPEDGYQLARAVIEQGTAIDVLQDFISATRGDQGKLDAYLAKVPKD